MPEPAERIQPEQDYADKIAEAWLPKISVQKGNLAALIRSTLREQGTPAWAVYRPDGSLMHRDIRKYRPREWPDMKAEGYTVRRVLVLFQGGD